MKKNTKTFCYFKQILFLSFLLLSLSFCFVTDKALGLEAKYPAIAGQTVTASSEFPEFAKYLFNAGMAIGFVAVFVSLVIAGVMRLLSPVKADLLASSKDRIVGAISGLLILVLTYLIVTTINPGLNAFKLDKLPDIPVSQAPERPAGVYLYRSSDDNNVQNKTSSISYLGELTNRINFVEIVQGQSSYISILYENANFWGSCKYIDPTVAGLQPVTPFASSVSIHQYDFSPNGDGVYFYRKSYFDEKGGLYKVDNAEINGIYIEKLQDLVFEGVPEEEQDCVEYSDIGECERRTLPTLAGENISSVKIKGNYLVLFVYFGPGDKPDGIWTSCQEFPTPQDVNKEGPRQIKWQNIRVKFGVIPNYVVIIPIKK